ncbi:hypothetical protein [uncultured Parvibaculum sp.]|uniref:lipopolysaccharide biosynthesis protein n=1 Tax=uncultured Parvibaculum sp. TaxID=291828 RepID=UPI0030DB1462|tara:strand:- start:17827 stop:19026 length:1200 start_codon:yes stop_codon:yes gene_type:complete
MLASLKVWATYLAPAEVGLMGLAVGISSIFVGIAIGPVTQVVLVNRVRYQDRDVSFQVSAADLVLRGCLLAVLMLTVFGVPISFCLGLSSWLPLLVASLVVVEGYRAFEMALLAAQRRQRDTAVVYGGDACARLAGLWFMLHFFAGTAEMAMLGTVAGAAVFTVVSGFFLRREALAAFLRIRTGAHPEIRKSILHLAKPLFPAAVLSNTTEMLGRYVVALTAGLGAAGLFVIGYGLVKRPYGLVNGVTDWTMRPALAGALADKEAEKAAHVRLAWLGAGGGIAALGVVLFYLLDELIVHVLLSPEYVELAELLIWFAVAVTLFNIANIFGGFSLVAGKSRQLLINSASGAIACTALTVLLTLCFGLKGAVLALVGGYAIQLIVSIAGYVRTSDSGRDRS